MLAFEFEKGLRVSSTVGKVVEMAETWAGWLRWK